MLLYSENINITYPEIDADLVAWIRVKQKGLTYEGVHCAGERPGVLIVVICQYLPTYLNIRNLGICKRLCNRLEDP